MCCNFFVLIIYVKEIYQKLIFRTQKHAIHLLEDLGLSLYRQNYNGKTVNILCKGQKFYTTSPLSLAFKSLYFAYDFIRGIKKVKIFPMNNDH